MAELDEVLYFTLFFYKGGFTFNTVLQLVAIFTDMVVLLFCTCRLCQPLEI